MNKFDEKYNIRLATVDDIEKIIDFIKRYWKEDHIFVTQRDIFEYEMRDGDKVNFILAEEKETGELHGIVGFIPASKDPENLSAWGCMWKVRADVAMAFLGMEISKRMSDLAGIKQKLSIGLNPKTAVPVKKYLMGQQVDKMKHYYCLANKKEYRIAIVKHYKKAERRECQETEVKRLHDINDVVKNFDIEACKDTIPFKDRWYIEKRYFRHPVYSYMVYGLSEAGKKVETILVCREQEYNSSKCLRIVDCIGNEKLLGGLYSFLQEQLKEYEYIDFYFYGIDEQYVQQAGMTEVFEDDTNIIPNYFCPFVAENIDIWVDVPEKECRYFKADGDQDRPN